jgi:hypothetical protein
MADTSTIINSQKRTFRFVARIENGVIVPQEEITLPSDQTYLVTIQLEPVLDIETEPVIDALAQLVSLAQPLGPTDLARNFDTYINRVIPDELAT